MVDVGAKPETARRAVASAAVRMSAATLALVARGTGARGKGDVLATARLAAVMACKRTAERIPLCHPVRVVGSDVALDARPPPAGRARRGHRARLRPHGRRDGGDGRRGGGGADGLRHGQGRRARRRDWRRASGGEERRAERRLAPRRRETKCRVGIQRTTRKADRTKHVPAPAHEGRHHRLRPGRLHGGHLRGARQPRARPVRGRRRDDRADHAARRPADDHDRGRELPRLPERRAGPGADGAVQGAGRALRHARSSRPTSRRSISRSGRSTSPRARASSTPTPSSSRRARRPSGSASRRSRSSRTTACRRARPATARSSAGASSSSSAAATRPWRRRRS